MSLIYCTSQFLKTISVSDGLTCSMFTVWTTLLGRHFRGLFSLSFLVTWPVGVDNGFIGDSLALAKSSLNVLVDFVPKCFSWLDYRFSVWLCNFWKVSGSEFCLSNEGVQKPFLAPCGNTVRSCTLLSLCWSENLWLSVFLFFVLFLRSVQRLSYIFMFCKLPQSLKGIQSSELSVCLLIIHFYIPKTSRCWISWNTWERKYNLVLFFEPFRWKMSFYGPVWVKLSYLLDLARLLCKYVGDKW